MPSQKSTLPRKNLPKRGGSRGNLLGKSDSWSYYRKRQSHTKGLTPVAYIVCIHTAISCGTSTFTFGRYFNFFTWFTNHFFRRLSIIITLVGLRYYETWKLYQRMFTKVLGCRSCFFVLEWHWKISKTSTQKNIYLWFITMILNLHPGTFAL